MIIKFVNALYINQCHITSSVNDSVSLSKSQLYCYTCQTHNMQQLLIMAATVCGQ